MEFKYLLIIIVLGLISLIYFSRKNLSETIYCTPDRTYFNHASMRLVDPQRIKNINYWTVIPNGETLKLSDNGAQIVTVNHSYDVTRFSGSGGAPYLYYATM